MGMYAMVNGEEIKFSGLLAIAGSKIATIEDGAISFSYSQLLDLAVELAAAISNTRVQAHEIHLLREISMACHKLEALVLWLDDNTNIDSSLTFC
jgi:hypothetical protein